MQSEFKGNGIVLKIDLMTNAARKVREPFGHRPLSPSLRGYPSPPPPGGGRLDPPGGDRPLLPPAYKAPTNFNPKILIRKECTKLPGEKHRAFLAAQRSEHTKMLPTRNIKALISFSLLKGKTTYKQHA